MINVSKEPSEIHMLYAYPAHRHISEQQYHMAGVWTGAVPCLEEFPPDIRTMFLFLKYQDDPEILMTKLADAAAISLDAYDTIADFTGDQKLELLLKS